MSVDLRVKKKTIMSDILKWLHFINVGDASAEVTDLKIYADVLLLLYVPQFIGPVIVFVLRPAGGGFNLSLVEHTSLQTSVSTLRNKRPHASGFLGDEENNCPDIMGCWESSENSTRTKQTGGCGTNWR